MENKYSKCQKCPAFHLLTEERKEKIEKWEYKRDKHIERMKSVKLILLGECMPSNRYFYDINTDHENRGLRYTLKKEFNKLEISDSLFLESMVRKGIALYDCSLCPLYHLDNNVSRRKAATHCLMSINHIYLNQFPDIPIFTIFPLKLGFMKTEIPGDILMRVKGEFNFSDPTGLRQLFETLKESKI
jgi:hypothetical protein